MVCVKEKESMIETERMTGWTSQQWKDVWGCVGVSVLIALGA